MQTKTEFIQLTTSCFESSIYIKVKALISLELSSTAVLKWCGVCPYPSSSTDEQLLELNVNQPAVLEIGTFPFVLRLTQERCAYTNTAIKN